jgi:hypothetical protein
MVGTGFVSRLQRWDFFVWRRRCVLARGLAGCLGSEGGVKPPLHDGFGFALGGADFGPFLLVSIDELLLGEDFGQHEMAEIGKGSGGFGFDETLDGSGEEPVKGGCEIAGGNDIPVEKSADAAGALLGFAELASLQAWK